MANAQRVAMADDLLALQRERLALDRTERDELHAHRFAPAFIPCFRELPLHASPSEIPSPTALVSILGQGAQPVAVTAGWVQIRHMLVVGARESFAPDTTTTPLERPARKSSKRRAEQTTLFGGDKA